MQTAYNFSTPVGVPGGLYDLNNYTSDTRRNEEATGVLKFGMGVVVGSESGVDVKLPTSESTVTAFEGVVQNGFNTEHNLSGEVSLVNKETVGVVRTGRIWARLGQNATPAYGKEVYLITSGSEAGLFTTDDDESTKILVNGRYLKGKGSTDTAPIEVWPTYPVVPVHTHE